MLHVGLLRFVQHLHIVNILNARELNVCPQMTETTSP